MKLFLTAVCCIVVNFCYTQEKSKIKFGKIVAENFATKAYALDSNANAIVLSDIGNTEIVGNYKGWFSLEYTRHKRVHILKKNGYNVADVQIGIYSNGTSEEELQNLKAVTYNVENGRIVETKLEKSNIFKDVISKNYIIKKFTFPNIKEGSIVEFEYKLVSDFLFNLQPWDFQGQYPCLWSEYNVSMPEFLNYVKFSHGYIPFFQDTKVDRAGTFVVADDNNMKYVPSGLNNKLGSLERTQFTASVSDYKWVIKDVPALKEENFTSTLKNHLAGIEFQLAEYRQPLSYRNIMGTWPGACKNLMEDEDFGLTLSKDNGWLDDVVAVATKNSKSNFEKAKSIFEYIRDNFTCTNHNSKYLRSPLKTILKNKNGNEAEINLLLTAMLKKVGLLANPVLLSTRTHGVVYSMYPLMDRFNYVICELTLDNIFYYLDASMPRMGFGKLSANLYNGHARVINEFATPISFDPDSLVESKITSILIFNADKPGLLTGNAKHDLGYYESFEIRNKTKESGKESVISDIKKGYTSDDISLKNFEIDSLNQYENPVRIRYDIELKTNNEDILYFNPMFGEATKENPFKSAERLYPVELPYTADETYMLSLDVPTGYVIDELPKQTKVKLNPEGDGVFEYRVSQSDGTIYIKSRVKLKRTVFMPEEYDTIREFFNFIIKKQSEQIVFKKKS